jgi:hypothetical protein
MHNYSVFMGSTLNYALLYELILWKLGSNWMKIWMTLHATWIQFNLNWIELNSSTLNRIWISIELNSNSTTEDHS